MSDQNGTQRLETTGLTASEREVLADAARGLTAPETARRHSKSIETVKSQRRSIMLKLGARNMAHAVAMTMSDQAHDSRHAA